MIPEILHETALTLELSKVLNNFYPLVFFKFSPEPWWNIAEELTLLRGFNLWYLDNQITVVCWAYTADVMGKYKKIPCYGENIKILENFSVFQILQFSELTIFHISCYKSDELWF